MWRSFRRLLPVLAVAIVPAGAVAQPAPDARAIARDAYVWGYATVDLYAILHGQALDRRSPEFRAPLNQIGHFRTVATPDDRVVIAPNVDTPYSYAWLDLRTEPVVITIPPFERTRYVSLMLVDLSTYILGYVTPRTNGHTGGDFLVAGPGWAGDPPTGVRGVFRSPTALALGLFRTQLFDPADLPRVHALQDRYRVRSLSAYLGRPSRAPAPRPLAPLVAPVNLRETPVTLGAFDVLGWMLRYMPPTPTDTAVRRRMAGIGLDAGQSFAPRDSGMRATVLAGMQDGLATIVARARTVRSSAELFGSRELLGPDHVTRAAGAMLGILGNAAEEYLGIGWSADADGRPFDGTRRYTIRFAPDSLPPVGAFWSITVYDAQKLLYANPLRRYVINSPMLPSLVRDRDGAITLHVQHDSPGKTREPNWLPVPATAFGLTFRTYLPEAAIREGRWTAPPVVPRRDSTAGPRQP